jgi:multidrug resistance efflux pump
VSLPSRVVEAALSKRLAELAERGAAPVLERPEPPNPWRDRAHDEAHRHAATMKARLIAESERDTARKEAAALAAELERANAGHAETLAEMLERERELEDEVAKLRLQLKSRWDATDQHVKQLQARIAELEARA